MAGAIIKLEDLAAERLPGGLGAFPLLAVPLRREEKKKIYRSLL